jgi:hypothetical protein
VQQCEELLAFEEFAHVRINVFKHQAQFGKVGEICGRQHIQELDHVAMFQQT